MSNQEKKFHVFKHVMPSAQYVFQHEQGAGRTAVFVNHLYYTDDPQEIAELEAACADMARQAKRGFTAYMYVDPDFAIASQEDLDPNAALRKKIREEERTKLLAELNATHLIAKDAGNYEAGKSIVPSRSVPQGSAVLSNSGVPQVSVPKVATPAAHQIDKA